MIKRLQTRIDALQRNKNTQPDLGDLKSALSAAMKSNLISDDQAERLVRLVSDGKLQAKVALDRLKAVSGTSASAKK